MAITSCIKQSQSSFTNPLIVFVACLLFAGTLVAEGLSTEYRIKAAYLYKFTKFVYWPQKDTSTFNLCLVGKNSLDDLIKPIEQQRVQGKLIRLFYYPQLKEPFRHCDMIYFSATVENEVIQKNTFNGILTVGEQQNFIHQGGMINLVKNNNRVTLQVNKQTLEKNGLEVSGKLLEIAEVIEGLYE